MADTWHALTSRRNVRAYTTEPIPADQLDRILEAGRRTPSASNRQHWDLVVVTDPAQLAGSSPSPSLSPQRTLGSAAGTRPWATRIWPGGSWVSRLITTCPT
jgi:nitroreductase